MDEVVIYTDGACINNPKGPGGYGAVLLHERNGQVVKKELKGGYNNSTNNRMELMAVIVALEVLKKPCHVKIFSDSKYIVDAINLGWIRKWEKCGWYKSAKSKHRPKNIDLWKRLLAAMESHDVHFSWVKGHSGVEFNERCDQLANEAALQKNLPEDERAEEEESVQIELSF